MEKTQEKLFEVRVVNLKDMSEHCRAVVNEQVSKWTFEERRKYSGFAKITYVTSSPMRIKSVEPIKGSIATYFNKQMKEVDLTGIFN